MSKKSAALCLDIILSPNPVPIFLSNLQTEYNPQSKTIRYSPDPGNPSPVQCSSVIHKLMDLCFSTPTRSNKCISKSNPNPRSDSFEIQILFKSKILSLSSAVMESRHLVSLRPILASLVLRVEAFRSRLISMAAGLCRHLLT